MSPAGGSGANAALRDAALLAGELAAAARGEKALLQGIGDYERRMTDYGFAAVRASRATAGRPQSSSTGWLASWLARPSSGSSGERRPAAGSPLGYSSLTVLATEMAISTCSRRLAV